MASVSDPSPPRGEASPTTGGRTEIPNVKSNKEVQDLGKFCVDEYNMKHQAHLVFSEVVKAESQVVAGVNYYLKIYAADGGVPKTYNACVFRQESSKQLVSFGPSPAVERGADNQFLDRLAWSKRACWKI